MLRFYGQWSMQRVMASLTPLLRLFAPVLLVFSLCALSLTLFTAALCFADATTGMMEGAVLAPGTPAPGTPAPDTSAPVPVAPVPEALAPDALDPAVVAAEQEAARPKAVLLPPASPDSAPVWEEPEPGFEYARFPALSSGNREMDIMVVRVDPHFFEFVIRAATMPGEQPRTLQDWAAKHNLAATINAGMYLPDQLTSTGYLRVGEHLNNARMSKTFGALFLSEPRVPGLPSALLLDRADPNFDTLLPQYANAVQNYRMINANRRLLWRPAPQEHAVAALGVDGAGRILLIHCREPVTGVDFATMALDLPIDLRTLMYLEGGTQAGLYLRPGGSQLRVGRHPVDFWTDGSVRQLLPNIIGVRAKNASRPKDIP